MTRKERIDVAIKAAENRAIDWPVYSTKPRSVSGKEFTRRTARFKIAKMFRSGGLLS